MTKQGITVIKRRNHGREAEVRGPTTDCGVSHNVLGRRRILSAGRWLAWFYRWLHEHEYIEEEDESAPIVPEHVLMDAGVRALTQPSPCAPSQIYLRRYC